jgi:hypothetical protein
MVAGADWALIARPESIETAEGGGSAEGFAPGLGGGSAVLLRVLKIY